MPYAGAQPVQPGGHCQGCRAQSRPGDVVFLLRGRRPSPAVGKHSSAARENPRHKERRPSAQTKTACELKVLI